MGECIEVFISLAVLKNRILDKNERRGKNLALSNPFRPWSEISGETARKMTEENEL